MNPEPQAKRPVFLTVLCILTFIMTGLSAIGLINNAFRGKSSPDQLEEEVAVFHQVSANLRDAGAGAAADFYDQVAGMLVHMNEHYYQMLFINFITLVLGFVGALLMWKGRRIGFHVYVIYNLVGILAIYAAVPASSIPNVLVITQVIISAIFIFMYARNLHWMK